MLAKAAALRIVVQKQQLTKVRSHCLGHRVSPHEEGVPRRAVARPRLERRLLLFFVGTGPLLAALLALALAGGRLGRRRRALAGQDVNQAALEDAGVKLCRRKCDVVGRGS